MSEPPKAVDLDDVDSASHLDRHEDMDVLMREARRIARHVRIAFYETDFRIDEIENYEVYVGDGDSRRMVFVLTPPREGRGHTVTLYSWQGYERDIDPDLEIARFDTSMVVRESVGKAIASFIKTFLEP